MPSATGTAAGASTTRRKRALVVGGGFAGVEAATDLQKAGGFDVTLVSDRDFLYLFPISVWVPTRGIPFERAKVSLEGRARRDAGSGSWSTRSRRSARPRTSSAARPGTYAYDYLVVATGAEKLRAASVRSTRSRSAATPRPAWTSATGSTP